MNRDSGKLLLGFAAAGAITVGTLLVVGSATYPIDDDPDAGEGSDAIELRQRAGDASPLASFAPAWSRDLRQSLTEGESAAVATSAGANALSVRLVGTIFDPIRPRGIFVTGLGQMELRAVGEKAGGAEVLRIDERSATLSIAGESVTIKVEKAEASIPDGGSDPAQPPTAKAVQ